MLRFGCLDVEPDPFGGSVQLLEHGFELNRGQQIFRAAAPSRTGKKTLQSTISKASGSDRMASRSSNGVTPPSDIS